VREYQPQLLFGNTLTLESRFLGIVYGSGAIITTDTPGVTSIVPNSALTGTVVRSVINGFFFDMSAVARLSRAGPSYIYGSNITWESSTSMEATFDLAGAATGAWNVDVVNNGGYGNTGSLANGFTITSPGAPKIIGTPWNDPNPFNPSNGPTRMRYTLSAPATVSLYLFNQKGDLIWSKTYGPDENGGKAGENDPVWDGMTAFRENIPTGVYILRIVSKSGGSAKELGRIKIAVLRQ
jgi:hypothetical protein